MSEQDMSRGICFNLPELCRLAVKLGVPAGVIRNSDVPHILFDQPRDSLGMSYELSKALFLMMARIVVLEQDLAELKSIKHEAGE